MFALVLIQSGFEANSLSIFAALMAGFLVFTHRSNIVNLRKGNELRFERAYYKNWFK